MTPEEQLQLEMEMAQAEIEAGDRGQAVSSAPTSFMGIVGNRLADAPGVLNSTISGLTGGWSDEALGRIGALGQALMGAQQDPRGLAAVPELYNLNVDPMVGYVRESTKRVQEDLPVSTGVADVAGSLISPINKVGGNIPIVGPAAQGFIYGAGGAEGGLDERLESGTLMAALGGGLDAGTKGIGYVTRKVTDAVIGPKTANAWRGSAVGISKADRGKAVKTAKGRAEWKNTGVSPLDSALDTAEELKILKSLDPSDIKIASDDVIEQFRTQQNRILSKAEAVRTEPLEVGFEKVRDWVRKLKGTEREQVKNLLDKELKLFGKDFNGSLLDLQRYKEEFGQKGFTPNDGPRTRQLYRRLTNIFKETLEEEVDKLVPGLGGELKDTNSTMEHVFRLQDIFERNASKAEGEEMSKQLLRWIRTSGGVGSLVLGGLGLYGATEDSSFAGPALAGATIMGLNSPGVQMQLSRAARNQTGRRVANAISNSSAPIVRGVGGLTNRE